MDQKIKEWYVKMYPTDELGPALNEEVTFTDLFETVATNGAGVYDTMGAGDSIIRERLFEKLSELLGKPYAYVYDLWLSSPVKEVR